MKRTFFLVIMTLNIAFSTAQTANEEVSRAKPATIKEVLMAMPDSIVQYLNSEQRAELCRFSNTQDTLKVKNTLNGETYIDSISDTFANVVLNNAAQMQIKLLPLNDSSQVVCTIKTVSKPVADSRVNFYSVDWNKLQDTFGLPNQNNEKVMLGLLTVCPDTMSMERYNELIDKIEPVITSASFSREENATITYSLSLPMLDREEKDVLKSIIKQKSFNWDGHSFNKN